MRFRLVSLVLKDSNISHVKHYVGLPPELSGTSESRHLLPRANILLIEELPSGVSLERFLKDGSFVGDTWHKNIDDAKYQAQFEFGDSLGMWRSVPSEIDHPIDFALNVEDSETDES